MSQPLRAYLLKGFLCAGDLIGRWFCFRDRAAPRGWLHPGLAYGPHPRQKLDVIEQEGRAPQSVVAYLHGGGWIGGDKERMMRSLLGSGPEQFERNAPTASPIHQLTDRMPPCFLCASDLDPLELQPQPLEMARRLRDRGAVVARVADGLATLRGGGAEPYDVALLATGVRPSPIFTDSGLPVGPAGGLLVNDCLRSGPCGYLRRRGLHQPGGPLARTRGSARGAAKSHPLHEPDAGPRKAPR